MAAYRRTPTQRGPDLHTGFRIATRFPFGLFEKSRLVESTGALLVYPAVDPIVLPPSSGGTQPGTLLTTVRGSGEDFLGLTLARPGDDPRDIHWRKSAALGQRVKRERARDARPDVTLTIDPLRPEGADYEWESTFERHIREIASHAVAHLRRGDRVALVATTGGGACADRNIGADPLLRYLALLKPVTPPSSASLARQSR